MRSPRFSTRRTIDPSRPCTRSVLRRGNDAVYLHPQKITRGTTASFRTFGYPPHITETFRPHFVLLRVACGNLDGVMGERSSLAMTSHTGSFSIAVRTIGRVEMTVDPAAARHSSRRPPTASAPEHAPPRRSSKTPQPAPPPRRQVPDRWEYAVASWFL